MKVSLRVKGILFIVLVMLLAGTSGFMINRRFVEEIISDRYKEKAVKVCKSVAGALDPGQVRTVRDRVLDIYNSVDTPPTSEEWGTDAFKEYVSMYDSVYDLDEYKYILNKMQTIQDTNEVESVYVTWLDYDRHYGIYLADASHDLPSPVGCLDSYDEGWAGIEDAADTETNGVPPYETRTDAYGWLVTTGYPITASDGELVGYAYVDISLDDMVVKQKHYDNIMLLAMAGCILFSCILGVILLEIITVRPIKQLTDAASEYKLVTDEFGRFESNRFGELNLKSGDEIEVLANSMKKMERDLNEQIENLFATRQELVATREHADIMSEMANRDALTGIRNKRGYETEIQRINKGIAMGNTKVGVVMVDMNDLKEVNDRYGHEKGDKVICSLCDMLCSVFKRSPVFRVGGDEFVVIVSNYDYVNLESNVDKFKKSVEHNIKESELEPWERASAAIGYAIFEEGRDIAIEDTLKRADDQMYACKKEMKEKYNNITETEGNK